MKLRKMSAAGDTVVAEWNETATASSLEAIEKEFNECLAKGYFAADITPGREPEIIKKFDPTAEMLLMPRLIGG